MIEKIISGGQTGADRAALDVALKLGIPHGGWIPKGRKTEKGPLPERYRLKEMPTDSYEARTEKNVQDSDGTLIIARGKLTGGSDYTRKMTLKHKKQLLGIDLSLVGHYDAGSLAASWIRLQHVEVLNVAGPRASEDRQI
ncbi:putative molybdenum carrier protein [Thermodesulfobacteriota bacterium]